MSPIWSPSLNGSSTAGKYLTHGSALNQSNAEAYQTRWMAPRTTSFGMTKQHDDDEDDLLFNGEDIMSTEQLKQLFLESIFLVFNKIMKSNFVLNPNLLKLTNLTKKVSELTEMNLYELFGRFFLQ